VPWTSTTYYSLRNNPRYGFGFDACSGATSSNIMGSQVKKAHDPSDSLFMALGFNTALVTLTAGGDDLQFAKVLEFCDLNHSDCANQSYGGASTLRAWITNQLPTVRANLAGLYRAIRQKAPRANILVLGYPQVFPATAAEQNCASLRQYQVGTAASVSAKTSRTSCAGLTTSSTRWSMRP